ncbi:MAG: nitroreductase [Desulfovibrio sp.]|nr:nitroreductase [Desulfovibrio sp.]
MNEILTAIEARRSCRAYQETMPERALLEQIAKAGSYAASGRGKQSPVIIVVTDKATRDQISAMNARFLGVTSDPFYGAPCIMVVLADKTFPTYLYDGSLVMGNLMLAAHALGLGSCWIHRAKEEFACPEGQSLLQKWGLGDNFEGIGHCALGYPKGDLSQAQARKPDYIRFV